MPRAAGRAPVRARSAVAVIPSRTGRARVPSTVPSSVPCELRCPGRQDEEPREVELLRPNREPHVLRRGVKGPRGFDVEASLAGRHVEAALPEEPSGDVSREVDALERPSEQRERFGPRRCGRRRRLRSPSRGDDPGFDRPPEAEVRREPRRERAERSLGRDGRRVARRSGEVADRGVEPRRQSRVLRDEPGHEVERVVARRPAGRERRAPQRLVSRGGDVDRPQGQGAGRRQVPEPHASLEGEVAAVDAPGGLAAVDQLEGAVREAEVPHVDVGPRRRLLVFRLRDPEREDHPALLVERESREGALDDGAQDDDAAAEVVGYGDADMRPGDGDLRPGPFSLAPQEKVPDLERPREGVPSNRAGPDRAFDDPSGLADGGSRHRPLDRRQVEQPEEKSGEAEEDEHGPAQRPRGAADSPAARLLGVVHGVSREAAFALSLPSGAGPGTPRELASGLRPHFGDARLQRTAGRERDRVSGDLAGGATPRGRGARPAGGPSVPA